MRCFLKLYCAVFCVLLICLLLMFSKNLNMDPELYNGLDIGSSNTAKDYCNYLNFSDLTRHANNHHNFTVLQLNIRGLLNKQDKLKDLLNDIKNDSRVTIAMLVEMWLNKQNTARVKIPGYQFIGFHRKHKKGGGVGVLISQELQCRTKD